MYIILNQRWPYLLILTCNKHSWHPYQLQAFLRNCHLFQIPINKINGNKKTFNLKFELEVYLNNPVNEYASHPLIYLWLMIHILYLWLIQILTLYIVIHYVNTEFRYGLWTVEWGEVTGQDAAGEVMGDAALEFMVYLGKAVWEFAGVDGGVETRGFLGFALFCRGSGLAWGLAFWVGDLMGVGWEMRWDLAACSTF